MKNLLYFALCALPLVAFTSCDDEDDLPDVDFSISISGGKFANDKIYAVAGTDLVIDGITVTNNEQGKEALITYANYFWDFQPIGQSVVAPYGFKIYIPESALTGNHNLEITAPVYAVDKSPAFAVLSYTVTVVDDDSDIPANGSKTATNTPLIKTDDPAK